MTPNKITALRVVLAGVAVGAYACGGRDDATVWGITALALTVGAVALDGVDGFLARRLNLATAFGAQFDIFGDRVIENLFFIYFAVCGEISLWVPVIFFVRGALTDFLRGIASGRGGMHGHRAAALRGNWMLTEPWSQRIVAGRFSRGAYAALKCVCFCALGIEWMILHAQSFVAPGIRFAMRLTVNGIVGVTVAFCILRAVPVFWEGAREFPGVTRTPARPEVRERPQTLRAAGQPMVTAR
jgi:CDP-diacylglycerol--glycerol-3-phosphate 3-phosphatidyltransferase